MDRESPELIEQEMEGTRKSLTDKVAALENKVLGTVSEAQGAVNQIVDEVKAAPDAIKETLASVKDSVTDTVNSVKEQVVATFDLSRHTRENPWAMVGGAAAVGFVTGLLVFRDDGHALGTASGHGEATHGPASARGLNVPQPAYAAPAVSRRPAWLDGLLERAGQEVRKLGEQALSTASASLKQSLDQQLPKLLDETVPTLLGAVQKRVNNVVQSAGGQTSQTVYTRPANGAGRPTGENI